MGRQEILKFLEKNRAEFFTSAEIAKETNISRTATCRTLKKMCNEKIIEHLRIYPKGYKYALL